MTFDAPRKTLDEIRREIDAEYGQPPLTPGPVEGREGGTPVVDLAGVTFDGDEPIIDAVGDPDTKPPRFTSGRRRGRSGYIIAGIIGSFAGQLVLFGGLAVARYWSTAAGSDVSAGIMGVAPAPSALSALSTPESPPVSDTMHAISTAASRIPELSTAPSATETASSNPSTAPFVSVAPSSSAGLSSVKSPSSVVKEPKPEPRRIVKQPPAVLSRHSETSTLRFESRRVSGESEQWVKSQDEVRAALSQWLTTSGVGDDKVVSDTVVFLGADGRTARTHVPIRRGGNVSIREQRWERQAHGWHLVGEREAWQAR
jgi:hypothetical protein